MSEKLRCYFMYGLLGGPFPFGVYYSAGLDVLAKKIRELDSSIQVLPTFGFKDWRWIVRDIRAHPDAKIMIAGHSMGANRAISVAASLGNRSIDLIAAFDPTIWYPVRALGANVRHVIWFRGKNFLSPAGHGILRKSDGFTGQLDIIQTRRRHESIDDDEKFHALVISAVRNILRGR